jgi:NAD(P)-dependent dehydrogenase (short-subunit alcohol dehydrogenase family)
MRTWFVTGSSRGLGAALVRLLLESGEQVVATARRPEAVAAAHGVHERLLPLALDVTDPGAATIAVAAATARFGRIDVVVSNAGYGIVGAIEEVSDAEARALFDTNVFGTLNVLRAVLPGMRSRRAGRIAVVSSLSAFRGAAGMGLYSASKHALEGLTESLAKELEPLGIGVMAVAPGALRTEFLAAGSIAAAARRLPDYGDGPVGDVRDAATRLHGRQAGDPSLAAMLIRDAAVAPVLPRRLPIGPDAVAVIESRGPAIATQIAPWRARALATSLPDGATAQLDL